MHVGAQRSTGPVDRAAAAAASLLLLLLNLWLLVIVDFRDFRLPLLFLHRGHELWWQHDREEGGLGRGRDLELDVLPCSGEVGSEIGGVRDVYADMEVGGVGRGGLDASQRCLDPCGGVPADGEDAEREEMKAI